MFKSVPSYNSSYNSNTNTNTNTQAPSIYFCKCKILLPDGEYRVTTFNLNSRSNSLYSCLKSAAEKVYELHYNKQNTRIRIYFKDEEGDYCILDEDSADVLNGSIFRLKVRELEENEVDNISAPMAALHQSSLSSKDIPSQQPSYDGYNFSVPTQSSTSGSLQLQRSTMSYVPPLQQAMPQFKQSLQSQSPFFAGFAQAPPMQQGLQSSQQSSLPIIAQHVSHNAPPQSPQHTPQSASHSLMGLDQSTKSIPSQGHESWQKPQSTSNSQPVSAYMISDLLDKLSSMGFNEVDINRKVLADCNYDISKTVSVLLSRN